MAAVDIAANNNPPAPTDDLDDLFDYDVPADILEDDNIGTEAPNRLARAPLGDAGTDRTSALGIDKEIKITKRRAPVAKLDENKLLSQAGLPKLRRVAKEQLKLKGRGHEYSDVARLLNVYQLWLDDLYPRAKFADGLAIIEKLGHKKRLQAMRKEWINESKPINDYVDRETESGIPEDGRLSVDLTQQPVMDMRRAAGTQAIGRGVLSDDDLFLSTEALAETMDNPSNVVTHNGEILNVEVDHTAPSEDDLDALLAEDDLKARKQRSVSAQQLEDCSKDNFDDEMEVMAGMDMW